MARSIRCTECDRLCRMYSLRLGKSPKCAVLCWEHWGQEEEMCLQNALHLSRNRICPETLSSSPCPGSGPAQCEWPDVGVWTHRSQKTARSGWLGLLYRKHWGRRRHRWKKDIVKLKEKPKRQLEFVWHNGHSQNSYQDQVKIYYTGKKPTYEMIYVSKQQQTGVKIIGSGHFFGLSSISTSCQNYRPT